MAIDKIVAPLAQLAIFQGLRPRQLAAIAQATERIKFNPGEIITQAGEQGTGAYLIVSGFAERAPEPGTSEVVEPVEPGSLIGELAMLMSHAYGSTVSARERVFCLKITRSGISTQMLEDPSLTEHFQQHITSRLFAVAEHLRQIDGALGGRQKQHIPVAHVSRAPFSAIGR